MLVNGKEKENQRKRMKQVSTVRGEKEGWDIKLERGWKEKLKIRGRKRQVGRKKKEKQARKGERLQVLPRDGMKKNQDKVRRRIRRMRSSPLNSYRSPAYKQLVYFKS